MHFLNEILGLQITENRAKHRMQWKGDGVKWTIDEYGNIPAFSEVEAETAEKIHQEIKKF